MSEAYRNLARRCWSDLDEVDIIVIDTVKMQVDLLFAADFDAKLPVIVRRTRVDLRRQIINDRFLDGDDRRIFVARSCYATDEAERAIRQDIEMRIARLGIERRGELTVRQVDVARALRENAEPKDSQ